MKTDCSLKIRIPSITPKLQALHRDKYYLTNDKCFHNPSTICWQQFKINNHSSTRNLSISKHDIRNLETKTDCSFKIRTRTIRNCIGKNYRFATDKSSFRIQSTWEIHLGIPRLDEKKSHFPFNPIGMLPAFRFEKLAKNRVSVIVSSTITLVLQSGPQNCENLPPPLAVILSSPSVTQSSSLEFYKGDTAESSR